MPHHIKQINDDSIVVVEIEQPFQPREEIRKIHQKLDKLAHKLPRPIFRIVDLSQAEMDFAMAVEALSQDASNDAGSGTDWRFKLLFVGRDNITKMISDSFSQEQYGGIESRLFTSQQAAIAHARRELRQFQQ